TIDEIEAQLDPSQFFRINRQMIVNRQAIVEIEPYFHRKVAVKLKAMPETTPVVSRLKVSAFLQWVERG
ncbi:MAG: LytTR family transcriptional regulator, partial [Bacteroidetes bacterium]